MQNELYGKLKRMPEYKEFKRKSRMRSIGMICVIAAFWSILIFTIDFSEMDETFIVYIGILTVITIFAIRYTFVAFIKKPFLISYGKIIDIEEKKRTVNENKEMNSRITHKYLFSDGAKECWTECIYDYIAGREKKHTVGESVIMFNVSVGNSYIIKCSSI